MTFTDLQGDTATMFDHRYNVTICNERAVEVPVALRFISEHHGKGLEVGNVLGHYTTPTWDVVDKYEAGDGVSNIDVVDIEGVYDWIVAISTLEHVGWDENPRVEHKAVDAVRHLQHRLNIGGEMLVTVPTGHNPNLDAALPGLGFDVTFYSRSNTGDGNRWDISDFDAIPYAWDEHTTNGLWIGRYRR